MKRVLAAAVAVLILATTCVARGVVVRSTADSGSETLRWALQTARSGDVITFDPAIFPQNSPEAIYPRSELPPIHCGNVTVDASNAGVIIDGSKVPGEWNSGLQIYSNGNVVMGVQIMNFKGSGIAVCSASHNTIGGNRRLGTGPVGQGNMVCGNGIGIDVCDDGTSDNVITGNLIGVQADARTPCGNHGAGVFIEPGATHNTIGPDNIIAHNGADGVTVLGSAAYSNTITRNAIFENAAQSAGGDADIALRDGGNANLPTPVITEIEDSSTILGTASPNATVEVFSGDRNARAFEGATLADDEGRFSFHWTSLLFGSYLLCTATDPFGNTSAFSAPMSTTTTQLGEVGRKWALETRPSAKLADNRIGGMWNGFWQMDEQDGWEETFRREILGLGLKRARLTINSLEQVTAGEYVADMSQPEMSVIPIHDALFTMVSDWGVETTYTLTFWDKESPHTEDVLSGSRFQTEDQITRYLEFARHIVEHFKDRVVRFEIWNEPNLGTPGQAIALEDYIELVRRAIPVIRAANPAAEIQVGGTTGLREAESREYLFSILESDIMRSVEVVSWHPLFGESPANEAAYYYAYPSIVREIRNTAEAYGFAGEYEADEVTWWTHGEENDQPWRYSTLHAAKYYARGILTNLGLNCAVVAGGISGRPDVFPTIQNLCTVMAGHEAIDMPVEIDVSFDGPLAYCAFRYPNGDRMLAVWTDGIAQDEDPGVPATIRFPGLITETVTGIDVLDGLEQELVFEVDGVDTVIRALLVKDYPILIRLSDVTMSDSYKETVGDGFHRLGEPGGALRSGSGPDRDGDGIPDDQD